MRSHGIGVAALLLAGAAASVAGSTAALRLIDNTAISPGGAPLTNSDVRKQLTDRTPTASPGRPGGSSSASPQPSGPSKSPTQRASPAPVSGTFSTQGGNVFASCSAGQVTLTSWIPAQGYGSDDSLAGPATSAQVTFTSASGEITVTATCANGHPRFSTSIDDHHGGGAGGGGGGGGEEHGGHGGGQGGGGGGGHGGDG